MRSLLGDDFFADVEVVAIGDVMNEEDSRRIADEAIAKGQVVWMSYITNAPPKFVDADLPELKKLRGLRWLSLNCKGVTDDGVAVLSELQGLERLKLNDSGVSDKGRAKLAAELSSCQIER
jgi:hypothetical protein